MYRSECLVVSGVREGEASFEVPDSSPVGCCTVSTGNSDFKQENIAYIFSVEQLKNNGFSFTKIDNICLFYQIVTLYLKTNNDFPNPSF